MPLKPLYVVLFAVYLCISCVSAGCGDDAVCSNCGADGDTDTPAEMELEDEQELEPEPEGDTDLPDIEEEYDEDGDIENDDVDPDMPLELEDTEPEQSDYDYDFIDSSTTEFSAPGCVGEQEFIEEVPGEESPSLVFDEPVIVNRTGYSGAEQRLPRVADCGNGMVLAVWWDSRFPIMYALSTDEGNTWTENRNLSGVLPGAILYDLSVNTNQATALFSDHDTVYVATLPLPVTDIDTARWQVVSTTELIGRDAPARSMYEGEINVLPNGNFLINIFDATSHYYVLSTDGGQSFGDPVLWPHSFLLTSRLPGDAYLLVGSAYPHYDTVTYQILDSQGLPRFNEPEVQSLEGTGVLSLLNNGDTTALVLLDNTVGNQDYGMLRSNFDVEAMEFSPPTRLFAHDVQNTECEFPSYQKIQLDPDGNLVFARRCKREDGLYDRYEYFLQPSPQEPAEANMFTLHLPGGTLTEGIGVHFASGKKLTIVNRNTLLMESAPGSDNGWYPREYWDIDAYTASGEPEAEFMFSGTINDDQNLNYRADNANLVPLDASKVGIAWNNVAGVWVNTYHQARAGDNARWLYNLPELYSNFNPDTCMDSVLTEGIHDLITWDGRDCIVTFAALQTQPHINWECQGVALACLDSWSSFFAGGRPGPLEMLWCDPRGSRSGFESHTLDFAPASEYGSEFALVNGTYPYHDGGVTHGLLIWDKIANQWSDMQFFPIIGSILSVERFDDMTFAAFIEVFSELLVSYSYDNGYTWTMPRQHLEHLGPPGFQYYPLLFMHSSLGRPVVVVLMQHESNANRNNIGVLIYDCTLQEWQFTELPDLDHPIWDAKAVEISNGNVSVVYREVWESGILRAFTFNPETGYRSEPVIFAQQAGDERFLPVDVLYHNDTLSVAFSGTLPLDWDIRNKQDYLDLFVTQARIEY